MTLQIRHLFARLAALFLIIILIAACGSTRPPVGVPPAQAPLLPESTTQR